MARSFREKPPFKLFILFAVLFALPIIIASATHKTNLQQHASAITCGPNGQAPVCPVGYSCSYTAGNPNFGGTCAIGYIITAPSVLNASYTSCTKLKPEYITFSARLTLAWNKVNNATDYRVTLSDSVGTIYLSTTGTSITTSNFAFGVGENVYWYVQGHNKYSGQYGPASTKKYITFSCNK
jgi:hypothetical protein